MVSGTESIFRQDGVRHHYKGEGSMLLSLVVVILLLSHHLPMREALRHLLCGMRNCLLKETDSCTLYALSWKMQ